MTTREQFAFLAAVQGNATLAGSGLVFLADAMPSVLRQPDSLRKPWIVLHSFGGQAGAAPPVATTHRVKYLLTGFGIPCPTLTFAGLLDGGNAVFVCMRSDDPSRVAVQQGSPGSNEIAMMRLQSAISARGQVIQLIAHMVAAMDEVQQGVIRHMR